MKKMRKGFTLVELLIVITIIGLLGTMMLISGKDAQNAARVAKILEGFRNIEAAVMMYDEAAPGALAADMADATNGTKSIVASVKYYLKNEAVLGDASYEDAGPGTYYVAIEGTTLWLYYTLQNATGVINDMLAAKAADYGLKKEPKADPKAASNEYDGQAATVYYNVLYF